MTMTSTTDIRPHADQQLDQGDAAVVALLLLDHVTVQMKVSTLVAVRVVAVATTV